jgi:LCP family protein required for cell wall assembly
MISLPRDLWVEIPGFEPNRINTANLLGDANAYPGGGGPALAAKTVSTNFGIHVEKYISINFQVFTTLVETIAPGGVEICITETIDDPDYPNAGYGIIHVHFDPGCQRLTAEELLQYARTRATSGADFDRARRQQEVLRALRNEALSLGGITNLAAHAPALWDELADSYRTNVTLEELLALGRLMGEIDGEDIRSGVVDNRYVDLGTTPAGDQVLIPRASSVSFLFQQILNPHDIPDLAELRSRAQAEQASIVVFNNTSIVGLAGNTQEWLISQGVTITGINSVQNGTNAPTQIRDNTNNHWTARYLAALMGIPPERILPGVDGLTTEDVLVLVGDDILPLLNGETDSITGS